ncbi:uncharacterized protein LOC110116747 [Dendrobium catenatum]|uniref:uncharacterized protein LOC110116747 n=1 Tax=Dendrobium catenatum TaxID=906689 RepID=UPI0009F50920|nr:uncharacterized protein LOC110116747 [Dendrobium catenatum]
MDLAVSFSYKFWFKLRNNDCLWANSMTIKYYGRRHHSLCGYTVGNSKVWKCFCSVKWKVEPFWLGGLVMASFSFGKTAGLMVRLLLRCITWEKTSSSSVKLNVSGTKLGNYFGFGGVLRDHNGSFICAFAGPVGWGFFSRAVLAGVLHSLQLFINLNLTDVILEYDFDFRMIRNLDVYNFSSMEIRVYLNLLNYIFSIIPAMANASAAGLASIGCVLNYVMDLDFHLLPSNVKGLVTSFLPDPVWAWDCQIFADDCFGEHFGFSSS